jgi:hypothetical protein
MLGSRTNVILISGLDTKSTLVTGVCRSPLQDLINVRVQSHHVTGLTWWCTGKGARNYNQYELNCHHTKPSSMISKRTLAEVKKSDISEQTARIVLEALDDSCQLVHKAAAKRGA